MDIVEYGIMGLQNYRRIALRLSFFLITVKSDAVNSMSKRKTYGLESLHAGHEEQKKREYIEEGGEMKDFEKPITVARTTSTWLWLWLELR